MQSGLLTVAVIGGGFLGSKIAAEFAMSGGAIVRIYDNNIRPDQLRLFIESEIYRCERFFPSDAVLARRYMEEAVARVTVCTSIKDVVEGATLVSEAIAESLDAKLQIFRECEFYASPHCIFTTNTLTVSLKDIQSGLSNPERLIGLRFLAPVCFIPFVEVSTTGDVSSPNSSASKVVHYMSDIGKICFRYELNHDTSAHISTATAASSGLTADSLFYARQQAGMIRLRLTDEEAWRHQEREAKLRFGLVSEVESETSCCVCLAEPPIVLLASCGHQVLCKECAKSIQSQGRGACPICRLPIRGIEEVIKQ